MNSLPVDRPLKSSSSRFPKETKPDLHEVILGLEQFGLTYSRAQLKPLRGKLWEIKFSSSGGGFRMAYVLVTAEEMVVLHAFRKTTQKTPLRDLDLAEKRMKEVLGL